MSKEETDKSGTSNPANDPQTTQTETTDKSGTKKIIVDVRDSAERKRLEDELAALKKTHSESEEDKTAMAEKMAKIEADLKDKTSILEQQALEDFERDRKMFLDECKKAKLTDEQIAEVEGKIATPVDLERVKGIAGLLLSGMETMNAAAAEQARKEAEEKEKIKGVKGKAPTGKAPTSPTTFTSPAGAETFEDKVAMIDELYNRAHYKSKDYSPEVVADAKKKISTLFQSLTSSPAWQQLRNMSPNDWPLNPRIMACPQCKATLIGNKLPDKCPKCGFSFAKVGDDIPTGR